MMSYLWILLLGSLLAASAKAHDVEGPTDEAVDLATVSETDAPTAVIEEAVDDKDTAHTVKEETADEVEPTAEPAADADEPVTPTAEVTGESTTAAEEAEPETPAGEGVAEPETPTAANTEAEAAATTQEPAAIPDTDGEQPTDNGEEEPTTSIDATAAQEDDGADDQTPAVTDLPVADNEEELTDPAADEEPTDQEVVVENIVPKVRTGVEAPLPSIKADVAVPEVKADAELKAVHSPSHPGKSRSSGAHSAGATGEAAEPEAKEASSGSLAAIVSAIAVSVVGAVVGYFTYQKKKLCFKNRQEADPEAARKADAAEAQSDPQVLSNLLNSS